MEDVYDKTQDNQTEETLDPLLNNPLYQENNLQVPKSIPITTDNNESTKNKNNQEEETKYPP